MQSPSASFSPSTTRPPVLRLPDLVLWGCYALVLVMLVLAFNIRTLADVGVLVSINLLYTVCVAGAIYLVALAIRRFPPERSRASYAWFLAALVAVFLRSLLFVVIFAFAVDPATPLIRWLSNTLYVLLYGCVLVAGALCVPRRATIIGTIPRILVGSALIGCAAVTIVSSITALSTALDRTLVRGSGGIMPGLTLAAGFIVAIVVARYGRQGGPVVLFLAIAMGCLLLGSVLLTRVMTVAVDQAVVPFWFSSLYVIQNVLIAHGIYRSIERPPQFTPPDVGQPNNDWLFWSMLPRASAVVALLVAVASGQVPLPLLLVLGVVWIAHELVSFVDARRMVQQLARSPQVRDGCPPCCL